MHADGHNPWLTRNPWPARTRLDEVGMRAATVRWLLDDVSAPGSDPVAARRKRFDCIVIGAGVAGCVAALTLAKAGLNVVLLERGPYPGSKSTGGGAICARMMEPLLGKFWRDAPLEGTIVNQEYWFLTEDGAVNMGVRNTAFDREPFNRLSVLQARFMPWLAGQARRAGALLLVNHKVDRLIIERGRVTGVGLGRPYPQEYRAPVVIVAEGAGALLASQAGLVPKIEATNASLYAKAVFSLPPGAIRERFQLQPGRAALLGFIGYALHRLAGSGSLYTGRDCLGINAGAPLPELRKARVNPAMFLDSLIRHPFIHPLVAGGRLVEFGAGMIPCGSTAVPEPVHPGALITGDAAGLGSGTQGFDRAAYSGKFAAEAVIAAHEKGDFSAKTLGVYRELLEDSFIMRDRQAGARLAHFFIRHGDFMDIYPKMLNEAARLFATTEPMPERERRRLIWSELRAMRSPFRMTRDLIRFLRAIR